MTKDKNYTYALGRRKRSTARIRLFTGKGESKVNGKPISDYFKDINQNEYLKPFHLTDSDGKFYATARIVGGGIKGQIGAFVLGLSRALSKFDHDKFQPTLRHADLLTRDPREKERRKPGYAQAARARKQSPKR